MTKAFKIGVPIIHYAVQLSTGEYIVARRGSLPKLSLDATLYTKRHFAEHLLNKVKSRGRIKGDFKVVEVIVNATPVVHDVPKKPETTDREKTIVKKAISVVAEQLGHPFNSVSLESDLWDDLGGDSLDAVEVIMALEDEFDIDIAESDVAGWKTVGDIVNYLKTRPSLNLSL